MKILERFIKSLGDDQEELTLNKAIDDSQSSIERMLNIIDGASELNKSNIPEEADAKAEKEAANATDSVFTVEKKREDQGKGIQKSPDSSVPEEADIAAEDEAADATDKVFSVERKLGETPKSTKQAEVHLRKSDKKEEEEELEDVEEDEECEEDDAKDAKKKVKKIEEKLEKSSDMYKSSDSDTMEMFDVSLPLEELKKAIDFLAEEIISLRKGHEVIQDSISAIAEVEAKGFILNKSIASALDDLGSTPNQPKGQVSVFHKSFDQGDQGLPSVQEFSDVMYKSMIEGKTSADVASKLIANAEASGQVDPSYMSYFTQASK